MADPKTAAVTTNPGGTIQVPVPVLTGSDLEDGTYTGTSVTNTIIIQTLPSATTGVLYYNGVAVTPGQVIANYNPALLTVDPVDGAPTVVFTYSEVDKAGAVSVPATVTIPFSVPAIELSGNVYVDNNALTDNTVNGTGTNLLGHLYANLLNSLGQVIATVPVNYDGTYKFSPVQPGTYSVVLSTDPNPTTTPSLPAGWQNTGENLGAGAGSDGKVNGILPGIVVTTSSVTNANFGIKPAAKVNLRGNVYNDVNALTDNTVNGTGTNINNSFYATLVSNGQIVGVVPVSSDGSYQFTNIDAGTYTVVLGTNPSGSLSPGLPSTWANTGENLGSGAGNDGVVNGILPGIVVTTSDVVNANFGIRQPVLIKLSGTVYKDNTPDNTVNGVGTNVGGSLYANLVNSQGVVVGTVPVNADGMYVFTNVTSGNYVVVLSNTSTPTTSAGLPSGWSNTGENLGTGVGNDGFTNGILSNIVVTNVDVTNANFGINNPNLLPTLSGNVYDNGNGLTDGTVNGVGTNITNSLFVSLLNSSGAVVSTIPVNSDGSYNFGYVAPGNYTVVLNNSGGLYTGPSLPATWQNTGENVGSGAGNDGAVNGRISVTMANVDVVNVNFGVNKVPVAENVGSVASSNPGGTNTVVVPTLKGSDYEQCLLGVYVINSLPTEGTLYYNGVAVKAGDTIKNYDASKLVVDPKDGNVIVSFRYSVLDCAGSVSNIATVVMPFNVIPVELVYFNADKDGAKQAKLTWGTASELNSKSYEVYRSVDGVTWSFMTSQKAAGTSNTPRDYVDYDVNPVTGINYYRLKMIDLDGSYKWSGIRWVTFTEGEGSLTKLQMYPNPAHEYVSISGITNGRQVKLYDAAGKLVISQSVTGVTKDIYIGRLASGMYEVVLTGKNGEKLLAEKLLKQ